MGNIANSITNNQSVHINAFQEFFNKQPLKSQALEQKCILPEDATEQ